MEFTAQDLMYLFDAVATYSVSPVTANIPGIDQWSESVAVKIEQKLADMGYRFTGTVEYTVK